MLQSLQTWFGRFRGAICFGLHPHPEDLEKSPKGVESHFLNECIGTATSPQEKVHGNDMVGLESSEIIPRIARRLERTK
jgi:hypothetical protein